MSKPESAATQSPPAEATPRASPSDAPPLSHQDSADETASLLKQLTVGVVIDGKYRIDEVIGRGAMGVVVSATHVHLKERVALKFLSAKAHTQATDFHSRFRREAQVSAKLRNEHITRVIDVGVWHEKVPFMVMDHLVGDDLRKVLKSAGHLPINVALDYIVQICEGLAEAHSHGIVHRDLKPSNLFVTKRPDGTDLIKILDFGISKWSQQEEQLDELTQTGVVLGSPKYMAPEQLFGSATVDARADVWSIGAIFYQMLTGRPPYDFPTLTRICAELAADKPPPSLRATIPEIPEQLEVVVMQCFARDRDNRVSSVAELAGAVLDAVEAPFAGQVRSKIAAILDPKSQTSLSTTTSSGGLSLGTGNYRSLSITGSTPSRMSSSGAIRVAVESGLSAPSAVTTGGVESSVSPEATEAGKKRRVVYVGIAAGLVLGLACLYVLRPHAPPEPVPATPVATAPATPAAPASVASPAPSATATTPTPPVADSASAGSAPPAAGSHAGGGGGWHHHGGGGAPRPPPPPTVTAAPTPPPAPMPAPKPTQNVNPLEDRQ
jgi:serine/threonine-protein kinase